MRTLFGVLLLTLILTTGCESRPSKPEKPKAAVTESAKPNKATLTETPKPNKASLTESTTIKVESKN